MNPYIIKRPVITEKTLQLASQQNVFTFEVDRLATKNQIKEAIQELFKVSVVATNTVMSQRVAKTTGKKRLKVMSAKTKKACVKLKEGDSITLFDMGGQE